MELSKKGIKPSDIMTKEAFENAIKVHAAISGSTNALIHLPAIAHELGISLDVGVFDSLNRETPYLVDIQPSGKYLSELFWYAGGIPRVQIELQEMLDLGAMTVTGKTLGENLEQLEREGFFRRGEGFLANYNLNRGDIIRPRENSKGHGSIAVLKGNIAPDGAVIKFSAVEPDMLTHIGPARVFNREEEALDAVLKGKIKPGSVIVLRYEGPRGSGMPEMFATTEALATIPALRNSAIVTDGRFSGATRGPCVGHVSPEAISGGSIGLVDDDDLILIDIPNRVLSIVGVGGQKRGENEIQALLAERKKLWEPPVPHQPPGVLRRYSNRAASAMKGAYLEE
jgi:dihydroxy-acid dehydratase